MSTYRHPGIYVEEVPGSRAIEGASTDVVAWIGVAEAGPYDAPRLVTSWPEFSRTFGGWTFNRFLAFAVYAFFTEGGRQCYVVRAKPANAAAPATASLQPLLATATSEGLWPRTLAVQIDNVPPSSSGDPTPVFTLRVLAAAGATPAGFGDQMIAQFVKDNRSPRLTAQDQEWYVLEEYSGFTLNDVYSIPGIPPCPLLERVNGSSLLIRLSLPAGTAPTRPGNVLASFQNVQAARFDFATALASLDGVQDFSLLALPDSVGYSTGALDQENPVDQRTLIQSALTYAENREDAFVVADPPFGLDVSGVRDFKQGTGTYPGNALNSGYGALYYPWIRFADPVTAAALVMPPSGVVTGRYARTDATIGVWKAPAGINDGRIRLATGLERELTDAQQDVLNPAGIDAVRALLQYGIVVWGARTLSLDPEWRYVNVRRLVIYVERSISQGLQWVVFEPNSPRLWGSVVRDVTAFLTTLWRAGGLFGTVAAEAFFVICDETNNPPETRALGQLYVDVGLAVIKPAEFVILRITQRTAAAEGA